MLNDEPRIIELRGDDGLTLRLMDEGATWLSCRVPMPDGSQREVLLGCANAADYRRQTAYLGATIGRYANRIGQARITHGGQTLQLMRNPGSLHQLHGGSGGFHVQRWEVAEQSAAQVCFQLTSPAGDQGYPGTLTAQVSYRLLPGLTIEMDCEATVDAPSPVCITQHAYFNLDAVHGDVRSHRLRIAADRYLPVDGELIPTGDLQTVEASGFDFRQAKPIALDWLADPQQRLASGYDHAFLLSATGSESPACVLSAGDGSLSLQLSTTLPSLQFYAGELLAGTPSRGATPYAACAGVALEPQFLPDSPNHPEWPQPSCWLLPGQTYRHRMLYRFTTDIEFSQIRDTTLRSG